MQICFHGDSVVNNLPTIQESQKTRVHSLGQEDTWEEAWQPISLLLPGELHSWRNTVHGVRTSWTRMKRLSTYIEKY